MARGIERQNHWVIALAWRNQLQCRVSRVNRQPAIDPFSWEGRLRARATARLELVQDFAAHQTLIEKHLKELWEKTERDLEADYEPEVDYEDDTSFKDLIRENDSPIEDEDDYLYRFEVGVPRVFGYSTVTILWAAVEFGLRIIALFELERHKAAFSDEERSRGPIEKYKSFLHRQCNINLPTLPRWEELIAVQKVRDCIVHCAGNVGTSRDAEFLRGIAGRTGFGISISDELSSDGDVIEVDKVFVTNSIHRAFEFFDGLVERLRTHADSS